jgi:hypothetical protein
MEEIFYFNFSKSNLKICFFVYLDQRFEPKKSWVFGLDLDGKPKTQKKSKNPKNPKSKPKKNPKIQKIQNPNPKKIQKSNIFFSFLKSKFNKFDLFFNF